ncbi:programmed cell death protein 2 [Chytriomyces sp. MP71]|nr:programmed cell death protein 2 [Chytriomyces sp. MP71]
MTSSAAAADRPKHPHCKVCGQLMYLLAQIQTAAALPQGVPNAHLDRVLYVFACNKAQCSKAGSFVVQRAIKAHPSHKDSGSSKLASEKIHNITVEGLSSGANDFPPLKSKPVQPNKKKASMFATSNAFGGNLNSFGSDSIPIAGPEFGSGSDSFGGVTAFGASTSTTDDDISKLIEKRDAKYAAWMDDDTIGQPCISSKTKPKSSRKSKEKTKVTAAPAAVTSANTSNAVDGASACENFSEPRPKKETDKVNEAPFPCFPGFALEFMTADIKKKQYDLSHELELLSLYQKLENVDVSSLLEQAMAAVSTKKKGTGNLGEGSEVEFDVYEKTQVRGLTKTFKGFQKAVEGYPNQCLRYGFGSSPLLFNDKPFALPDPCPHCNAPRIFEMQLMPALLSYLPTEEFARQTLSNDTTTGRVAQKSVADLNIGVDFGTLLIYTCSRNCIGKYDGLGGVRLLDEAAVIQADDF